MRYFLTMVLPDGQWGGLKAVAEAKKFDKMLVESKEMIFHIMHRLADVVKEECGETCRIEIAMGGQSMSIAVDGTLCIKVLYSKVNGQLNADQLVGVDKERLKFMQQKIEVIIAELRELQEGKGELMLCEIEEIQEWVDDVSQRLEEDPELIRRIRNSLVLHKQTIHKLLGREMD